ncbi:MAG: cytochrome c oxidase subunit II [Actinomycetales bacterium]|nr:cytochrome c oxidase subunit II [Actinomycetales bacterium]
MGSTAYLPAARSRRTRALGFAMGALIGAVVLSGCTAREAFLFDLPEPATEQGVIIENLWQGSWIAAWGVGIVTWGLMLWAAVAYRRRNRQSIPAQTRYNLPIEILYTVAPLIMILGLFWFTARDQSELLTLKNDQQQTVKVVGYRWSWGFNYLDEGVYDTGMPVGQGTTNEPATLVLPVGEKVRFELNSVDVIHSFWVPAFLFKMDVIPGKTNVFEITPNKVGTYAGKCAELCGVDHARMLFQVKVVERADFDAYVESLKARGQTGLLQTGRFTDEGQVPGEKRI